MFLGHWLNFAEIFMFVKILKRLDLVDLSWSVSTALKASNSPQGDDSPQGVGPSNTMGPIEMYLVKETNSGGH